MARPICTSKALPVFREKVPPCPRCSKSSVVCLHGEHVRCLRLDCACPCHKPARKALARDALEAAAPAIRKQERERVLEEVREVLLSEDVRREIADIAAYNERAEDIARLIRKLLTARLAAIHPDQSKGER